MESKRSLERRTELERERHFKRLTIEKIVAVLVKMDIKDPNKIEEFIEYQGYLGKNIQEYKSMYEDSKTPTIKYNIQRGEE